LVFDYQSPTDFKFAGASIGSGRWVIGRRSGSSWITDAFATRSISANTDYAIQLQIESSGQVTLLVNGTSTVSFQFSGSLTDGELGLATWKSKSQFDDVSIAPMTPPPPPPAATLPVWEDFEDGAADYLVPRTGAWSTVQGRYQATPDGDTISTLTTAENLPAELDIRAVINTQPVTGTLYSNAFLIFDYQSPTDFKFAGASIGSGRWTIGHRSGSSWIVDASFLQTINALTDYALRVVIDSNQQATLYADGIAKVSHNFGGNLSDGQVGLATWNASSQFDDFLVQPYLSGMSITEMASDVAAAVERLSRQDLKSDGAGLRRSRSSEREPAVQVATVARSEPTSRDRWLVAGDSELP
jgi:hypothetical protein